MNLIESYDGDGFKLEQDWNFDNIYDEYDFNVLKNEVSCALIDNIDWNMETNENGIACKYNITLTIEAEYIYCQGPGSEGCPITHGFTCDCTCHDENGTSHD